MITVSETELLLGMSFCSLCFFISGYLLKDIVDVQKARREERRKK